MLRSSFGSRSHQTVRCAAAVARGTVARARTPYDVLEVDPSANLAQIKTAFRRKCLQYHPDVSKGKTDVDFMEAQKAYDTLSAHVLLESQAPRHHASGYDNLMKSSTSGPAAAAPSPAATPAQPTVVPTAAPRPLIYIHELPRSFNAPPESVSSWFRTMSMDEDEGDDYVPSRSLSSPLSSFSSYSAVSEMGLYQHFAGPVAPQPARAVVAAAYAAGKRRWF